MARILSAAALAGAFAARYPNAGREQGSLAEINASADKGHLSSVEAASVKGFAPSAGALKWVKAQEPFFVSIGEPALVGDFVEIEESLANRLIGNGKAVEADPEELKAAQGKAAAGTKVKA